MNNWNVFGNKNVIDCFKSCSSESLMLHLLNTGKTPGGVRRGEAGLESMRVLCGCAQTNYNAVLSQLFKNKHFPTWCSLGGDLNNTVSPVFCFFFYNSGNVCECVFVRLDRCVLALRGLRGSHTDTHKEREREGERERDRGLKSHSKSQRPVLMKNDKSSPTAPFNARRSPEHCCMTHISTSGGCA